MKTNEQIIKEITALMADAWLAACERRVIAVGLDNKSFIVWGQQERAKLFGPASGDECRLFIHRAAALDVLRTLGTRRVADAALMVVNKPQQAARTKRMKVFAEAVWSAFPIWGWWVAILVVGYFQIY